MTLDILLFLSSMTYFVKEGQNELADYMKKHEIVNKIVIYLHKGIKTCRLMNHII